MTTDSLNVEIVAPQSPLILADSKFLTTLAEVEGQIGSLAITDAPSAQLAASLQVRLTEAGKVLEVTRKQIKEPFLQAARQIDAAAAAPASRIEAAKTRIKSALSAYAAEQARIAREAEEARQKELRRLEAIAREEERLAKEKAAALAKELAIKAEEARKAAEVCEESVPEEATEPLPPEPPQKTETQKAIEAVRYAPVAVAAKPVGVTMRVTLVPEITDIRLVPDVFVERTAKIAAIRATYCTSYKEGDPVPVVPGISFKIDRQMVSTGRGAVLSTQTISSAIHSAAYEFEARTGEKPTRLLLGKREVKLLSDLAKMLTVEFVVRDSPSRTKYAGLPVYEMDDAEFVGVA